MGDLASAMQHLAAQIAGMGRGDGGGGKRIVECLSSDDETIQMSGLMELCDMLNMATQSTLATIRPASVVPPLLKCLRRVHNPDMTLMAARALTYLMDPFPEVVAVLGSGDNMAPLLIHLREINDLETAEQCITCLENVCSSGGGCRALLRAGGTEAMLGFVDFFTISIQRKVWSNVAAMAKQLDTSTYPFFKTSLPAIRQAVGHDDSRIQTFALEALERTISGVRQNSELVNEAFGDLTDRLIPLLTQSEGKDTTFDACLSLLYRGVLGSQAVTQRAIEAGLVETLSTLLASVTAHGGGGGVTAYGAAPAADGDTADTVTAAAGPASVDGTAASPTAASAAKKRLTGEEVKTVCNTLAALLVPCRDGALASVEMDSSDCHPMSRAEELMRQILNLAGAESSAEDEEEGVEEDYDDGEEYDEEYGGPDDDFRLAMGNADAAAEGEDDDDDDNDYEDVNEDEEADGVAVSSAAAAAATGGPASRGNTSSTTRPRIEDMPEKHMRCSLSHVCDGCGSRCRFGDWYRCNVCDDFDMCSRCLHTTFREHFDNTHSFTNMRSVLEHNAGRDANLTSNNNNNNNSSKNAALKKIEDDKTAMYVAHPELLLRVLAALPRLALLFTESEAVHTRLPAINFIASAVHMASPEQFLGCLEGNTRHLLCEVITSALCDTSRPLNIFGVYLANLLVDRLPDSFTALLVREGITHCLLLTQQRINPRRFKSSKAASSSRRSSNVQSPKSKPQSPPRSKTQSPALGPQKEPSAATPRTLYDEIEVLLAKFPAVHDKDRVKALKIIRDHLAAGELLEAARQLRECVDKDTTTFELSSNDIFTAIVEAFAKSRDIGAIVGFVQILCETPARSSSTAATTAASQSRVVSGDCALSHLVQHLHAFLSLLDDFQVRNLGPVNSVDALMEVQLLPHEKSGARDKDDEGGSGSRGGDPRMMPSRNSFRIQPLANVQTIVEFISNNILATAESRAAASRRNREASPNDDNVIDILPELADGAAAGKTGGATAGGSSLSSSSSAPRVEPDPPSVWVRYDKYILPLSMTMLQIAQTFGSKESGPGNGGDVVPRNSRVPSNHPMLDGIFSRSRVKPVTLYYHRGPFDKSEGFVMYTNPDKLQSCSPDDDIRLVLPSQQPLPMAAVEVLDSLTPKFPNSGSLLSDTQKVVLTLLGTLHKIIQNWPTLLQFAVKHTTAEAASPLRPGSVPDSVFSPAISPRDFEHTKLSHKALRHASNKLLAGQHTSTWMVKLVLDCPFLFTSTTRRYLFEVGFCGTLRSLLRMQKSQGDYGLAEGNASSGDPGRLRRTKMRVWRDHPLECLHKILGAQRQPGARVWEFEFYGEAGSGTGPTREFYHLVAESLRERSLGLWMDSDEAPDEKYYTPTAGLYIRPLSPSLSAKEKKSLVETFTVVGRFLSRAIIDEHIPALFLSASLLKLLRGDAVSMEDVQAISASTFRVLDALAAAARSGSAQVQLAGVKEPCDISTLDLVFTLPGDDKYELRRQGASTAVTADNMMQFCDAVTEALLRDGVSDAVKALRRGFNDYIPLVALNVLTLEELGVVVRGSAAAITRDDLNNNCLADHGFTLGSKQIQWLFEIIADMSLSEQSDFFLFLTGSPHLPIGGLSGLKPKLTIVRKYAGDDSVKEQDQLPSAMTCQNYLKMPSYDSKEQMEAKLRQAITDGKGAFHLT